MTIARMAPHSRHSGVAQNPPLHSGSRLSYPVVVDDDDILRALTPIGDPSSATPAPLAAPAPPRGPHGAITMSQRELGKRRRAAKVRRSSQHPAAVVTAAGRRLKRQSILPTKILTVDEQLRMASALSQQFYELSKLSVSDGLTPGDTKRAAVLKSSAIAWAVVQDKLTILQGRPTQIVQVQEADQHREAIRDVALRLASIGPGVRPAREQLPTATNK